MNFVELCRKGAGWPALHRDCPQFAKGNGKQSWSVTQEEVAAFVGQVRSRADDLLEENRQKGERIETLADEKAKLHKTISDLKAQLHEWETAKKLGKAIKNVRGTSESLGHDQSTQDRLALAVEDANR